MARSFIQSLPKAELHLHLEGSVEPGTLAGWRRHNTPLPTENNRYDVRGSGDVLNEDDVRRLYSLQRFQRLHAGIQVSDREAATPEDFELITYRLMQKLRQQNVMHAEVYVSVGVIRWRRQDFQPIFEGMESGRERGLRDFGISLLWIFDAVRHFGRKRRPKCLSWLRATANVTWWRLGLAGTSGAGRPSGFVISDKKAAEQGLRLTAHAGEITAGRSRSGAR